jgi:hypothetical protein
VGKSRDANVKFVSSFISLYSFLYPPLIQMFVSSFLFSFFYYGPKYIGGVRLYKVYISSEYMIFPKKNNRYGLLAYLKIPTK